MEGLTIQPTLIGISWKPVQLPTAFKSETLMPFPHMHRPSCRTLRLMALVLVYGCCGRGWILKTERFVGCGDVALC